MNDCVHIVEQDARLEEALRLLIEHDVRALFVVDDACRYIGVLSQTDVVKHQKAVADANRAARKEGVREEHQRIDRVTDAMTGVVIALDAELDVAVAARLMVREKVHRVLVESKGRSIGVVSFTDMVSLFLREENGARATSGLKDVESETARESDQRVCC